MLVGGVALADTHTWDGGHASSAAWNTPANWVSNTVPVCADNAVIETQVNHWPQLSQNEEITNLTMHDDAQLDTNSNTLSVKSTFTVSPNGQAPVVTISGGGTVSTDTFVIQGDANYGATITVSGAGTTVETADQAPCS